MKACYRTQQNQDSKVGDMLPDETVSEKEIVSDEMENNNNITTDSATENTNYAKKVIVGQTEITDTTDTFATGMTKSTVLPDETVQPSTPSLETLQMPKNIAPTTHDINESDHTKLDTKESIKQIGSEGLEELATHPRETVIGEITYTETDMTLSDNTIDNKDILMLADIPHGVSSLHPLETSSVISEPDGGETSTDPTPSKSFLTGSSSTVNPTVVMNKKEANLENRNRLKRCIIKLTKLSNSDRERWLSSENSSSGTNQESIESSDSSGSRYNMRFRPAHTPKFAIRTTRS